MHDSNGKQLKAGDQFHTYRYGLCTVESVNDAVGTMQVMYTSMNGGTFSTDQATLRKDFPEALKVRTWKELADEALNGIQNASNLSGIANSFAHVVREVRTRLESEGHGGNAALHSHPIVRMWADKIASLAHVQGDGTEVFKAYNWARDQLK